MTQNMQSKPDLSAPKFSQILKFILILLLGFLVQQWETKAKGEEIKVIQKHLIWDGYPIITERDKSYPAPPALPATAKLVKTDEKSQKLPAIRCAPSRVQMLTHTVSLKYTGKESLGEGLLAGDVAERQAEQDYRVALKAYAKQLQAAERARVGKTFLAH